MQGGVHMETLRNICASEPTMEVGLSGPAMTLIRALLKKNPQQRLSSLSDLKRQPFMSSIDWDGVLSKRVEAPKTPKPQNPTFNKI